MPERCPLIGIRADGAIPEICRVQCEPLWIQAAATQMPDHDEFDRYDDDAECAHAFSEFGGEFLQPVINGGRESGRIYSINEQCIGCDSELASDSYVFECPNN